MAKPVYFQGVKALTRLVVREASRSHYPRPPETPESPEQRPLERPEMPPALERAIPATTQPQLATTAETVHELRRRLAKELYRMELDLLGGGRIAGKPCDCLSEKHLLGLEATAEELMPMDNSPVYHDVISWLNRHAPEFEPAEVEKRAPEYYKSLAQEVRQLRKTLTAGGDVVKT